VYNLFRTLAQKPTNSSILSQNQCVSPKVKKRSGLAVPLIWPQTEKGEFMEPVVGIFNSSDQACRAAGYLNSDGIPDEHLIVLVPGASEKELTAVPTTDTEPPGVGTAIGGVVGGALGAASGMSLGAAAATFFVPGVGPVITLGILGAALLGVGGAAAGAAIGDTLDEGMIEGLPKDDLYVYEDALRKGRSVLIAFTSEGRQAAVVRKIMQQAGAEDIDAAREGWWEGLRDDEELYYSQERQDFAKDEANYRKGFEMAQHPLSRGKEYKEAGEFLSSRCPAICNEPSFRSGYERGRNYSKRLEKSFGQSA
jgi:hypothetical protein